MIPFVGGNFVQNELDQTTTGHVTMFFIPLDPVIISWPLNGLMHSRFEQWRWGFYFPLDLN